MCGRSSFILKFYLEPCLSESNFVYDLGMNRHHYALWVHGEKLIFLLRQEGKTGADMEVFKPAEFRWRIPQVNDNEWHHYAISVDFPDVCIIIMTSTIEKYYFISCMSNLTLKKFAVYNCFELGTRRCLNIFFLGPSFQAS